MHPLLLLLHLTGVVVWLGGMFFALCCLRPVAAAQLPPPQRLALLAAVLGRFFVAVAFAVAAIVGSGLATLAATGFAAAPPHWHLMMALGLLMAAIFASIALRHYPRLTAGIAAQDWPQAGAAMERIRRGVVVNLVLGGLTLAVATLGRLLAG